MDERTAAYSDIIGQSGRLNSLEQDRDRGVVSYDDYARHRSQIRFALLSFLDKTLKPEDVSLLRRTHDRILIVACKDRPENYWENLFPDAYFSHRKIIYYLDEVPTDFKAADVVIYDDLNCKGDSKARENFMRNTATDLPSTNLLYFGKKNPFQDSDTHGDDAIFDRMANANSRFTIHARLKELLEYRKIYGTPIPD